MSTVTREELLEQINNTGLSAHLKNIQQALVVHAIEKINGKAIKKLTPAQEDMMLLNHVGPAAAAAAVEYTINTCKKKGMFRDVKFNGDYVHNVKLAQGSKLTINDDGGEIEGNRNWSSVLRQFLLPRYAYLDFDTIVDPRHLIDLECGYPKFITPIMYRYMYDRDDVAQKVVDIYPDETWASDPEITDTDDDEETPFKAKWRELCENKNLLQLLYRMDCLCGIGHYGSLLVGTDDGKDLEAPIDELGLLMGLDKALATKERQLLYLRPFDEYLSFIQQYETDVLHPRYGLPKFYNLVFLDMTIDAAGASIGTRLNRRVHWSRVIHVADNLRSSLVFGVPRQQSVFNRELDLRKVKGCSAEIFWNAAFPGISFEIDPRFIENDPDFDREEFKETIRRFSEGQQKYLDLVGIKANSLSSQIPENPEKYIELQIKAIASNKQIPMKFWMGSENARVASADDKLNWNKRLGRRINRFVNPGLLRAVVDRFVAIGVMPPPQKGQYWTKWPDLDTATDEDKANLALKWTQALSQYVATGMIHLIKPMNYLTLIMGLKPSQAKKIIADVHANGGWEKLLKVDPSQGAGVNGKRENTVSKGQKEGTTSERPKERNTADKKAEGTAS